MVSVPVLSSTSASIFANLSNARPPLITTPCRKAETVPARIAIGVTSASSIGEPNTKRVITNLISLVIHQTPPIKRTSRGVRIKVTLSASIWILALRFSASSIRRLMRPNMVFSPIFSVFTIKPPVSRNVPANTISPDFFV
ncbi:MAG: hypothetical protein ACD_18C00256G0001 [uncultured bacterium]|nr:MAG: hypothetical protein ACD_18C00256G0001 [uncultured bacterium]